MHLGRSARNYARALDLLKVNRGLTDELAEELKAREEIRGRDQREHVAGRVSQPIVEVAGTAFAIDA